MPHLRAELAPASRAGGLGSPSRRVLGQRNHLLPSSLFNKITVLPMRLNRDLEALFVLSCGLLKQIAAFLGGSALSSLL